MKKRDAASKPRYPTLSPTEIQDRTVAMTGFYELLHVKVSEGQLKAILNLTSWIPLTVLSQALHELVITKVDGFQTAPQPGEIFAACRRIASRTGSLEWNVTTGNWSEPEWSRSSRRLLAVDNPKRLTRGSSDGLQNLQAVTREALEEVAAEYVGGGEKTP